METTDIVNTVEIPELRSGRPRYWFIEKMNIGDSFWIARDWYRVHASIRRAAKKRGCRVKIQQETKDGKHGIRVWRVG